MKKADHRLAVSTGVLLIIRNKQYIPAFVTTPSEEELAEGKVPEVIYPGYWWLDVAFDGILGGYSGPESVESTEAATDEDLLQGVKVKWSGIRDVTWTLWDGVIDDPETELPA